MTEIIGDRINEPIDSIDEVETFIMAGARTRVLSLDWPHFDVSRERTRTLFDFASPIILRNANDLDLPVSLLDENRPEEKFILDMIDHQHKREVAPESGFWLTMFDCPIAPDDATFTRDILCAKGIEVISAACSGGKTFPSTGLKWRLRTNGDKSHRRSKTPPATRN